MAEPVIEVSCACGQVRLEVTGKPIISAECCCTSCRSAAGTFEALPGAHPILTAYGATRYELYRKDRVRFLSGAEHLREHRLQPDSHTRRVVAGCCNSPVFTEFEGGHWLSLYGGLWPAGTLPPLEIRTMTSDLPDPSVLPDDVTNARRQNGSFFRKLLLAWVAMGFRVPKTPAAAPWGV
ncbi:MAG TPA: hypothetical protein PK286_11825 [Devosia sp.]|nr:hypothetical protein [Devosia sp.]